jgi:hypothetical protein
MVLPILLLGLAPLGACEQVDGDGTPIDPGAVEGILEILPREVTLTAIGDTAHLNPGLKTTSGHRIEPDVALEWSVSNPQVASVSSSGRVTARGTGRTTVRGKAGQQVDSVIVVVTQKPSRVDASPDTSTLTAVGSTTQLKAQVFDANGTPIPGASVSWYSTNPAVAEVNNTGRVTARGAGEARIVASAVGATADTVLVRVQPRPAKLTVSPESSRIRVGEAVQLAVTATDGNGAVIENPDVRWTSLNSEIASVNSRGRVTGVAAGKALIVVSAVCCGTADTASIIVDPNTSTVEPLFSDNFDTGSKNRANGFSWSEGPPVVSDRARSGKYSLRFRYDSTPQDRHIWAEQRFDIGQVLSEVWIEYYLWVPENYYHRDGPGTDNNKFFFLWDSGDYPGGAAGQVSVMLSLEYAGGGDSDLILMWSNQTTMMKTSGAPHWKNALLAARGKWNRIRYHIKAASRPGAQDGVFQFWWDDMLRISATNLPLYDNGDNGFRRGYLMGYDNSGYNERTDFYIDDFKVYSRNPGW